MPRSSRQRAAIAIGSTVLSLWGCSTPSAIGPNSATPTLHPDGRDPERARAPAVFGQEREAFVREVQVRFPESDFLVGIGESDSSAGMAESRAVADTAAAIRSRVERNFSAVETGLFRDGAGQQDVRLIDQIEQKVETDAGAFIRPRRELTRHASGGWLAAAVARREDLDSSYVEEARPLVEKLDQAYGRASAAPTWIAAAPAWCEASPLEKELERRSMERWAVSRRSLWTPELIERSRQLHARRQQAKASFPLVASPVPEGTDADPSTAIVDGLRRAGWGASAAPAISCSGEGLVLEPRLTVHCQHSELGIEDCRASLAVEARSCNRQEIFFTVTREAQGTDSRDPARATMTARRKLEVASAAREVVERALAVLGECTAHEAVGTRRRPVAPAGAAPASAGSRRPARQPAGPDPESRARDVVGSWERERDRQ